MWFDLFVVSTALMVGSVMFGHFEEPLPKTRRLGKLAITLVVTGILSALIGHLSLVFVVVLLILSMVYHVRWCQGRGIDPMTAEPWDEYLVHLRAHYGDIMRDTY